MKEADLRAGLDEIYTCENFKEWIEGNAQKLGFTPLQKAFFEKLLDFMKWREEYHDDEKNNDESHIVIRGKIEEIEETLNTHRHKTFGAGYSSKSE